MDKYYLGRKAYAMYIDECTSLGDSLREIAENISAEQIPKVPALWIDGSKYFKERQVESNDWRRKNKRGFNGYHRHV